MELDYGSIALVLVFGFFAYTNFAGMQPYACLAPGFFIGQMTG